MLDWLIVGGGVHGTHLAHVLCTSGTAPDRVRVLDPHAAPMARWTHCTGNTGMRFLRSSLVQHVGIDPFDLRRYAARTRQARGSFAYPFERPAHALFQAHAAETVGRYGLDRLFVQGRACGLARTSGGWRVETDDGALDARRVLLAISLSDAPARPSWLGTLADGDIRAHHLFDPDFRTDAQAPFGRAVVVGGGISAVQAALAFAERAPGAVTLVRRHALRVHQLDADPCWLGPRCLSRFAGEPRPVERRAMIRAARHRGSVPPEIGRDLRHAVALGRVHDIEAEVTNVRTDGGTARLTLCTGAVLDADLVVAATGFEAARPGAAWLDEAIERERLPVAPCGYPLVDRSLAWAEGLYVTGPLAELELGPVARNIAGARMAGRRLADA